MDEAFVYKYTHKINGMMYIGMHTGHENDGYQTSSSNEQFLTNLQYMDREILKRGSTLEMEQFERELLESVDAKNNPLYYNLHNGQAKNAPQLINFDKVESVFKECYKVFNNLPKQKYGTTILGTADLKLIPTRQVRTNSLDPKKVTAIVDILNVNNDKTGSTLRPIIIIEDKNSTDKLLTDDGLVTHRLLVDGNHTRAAILEGGLRQGICIVIPFEDLDNSLATVHQLGIQLNRPEGLDKSSNSEEDLKKALSQYMGIGQDIKDTKFQKAFAESVKKSVKKIKELVEKVKPTTTNSTFITRTREQARLDANLVKTSLGLSDDTVFTYMVSHRPYHAMGNLFIHMAKANKSDCVLVLYHNTQATEKAFTIENLNTFKNTAKAFNVDLKIYMLKHNTTQSADYWQI